MAVEFRPISADELAEIQATKRSGYAVEAMNSFMNSGESAVDASESFPGRKLSNVANALKRLTQRSEYSDVTVTFTKVDGEDRLILSK